MKTTTLIIAVSVLLLVLLGCSTYDEDKLMAENMEIGNPLVEAIHLYHDEEGELPEELDDLVPAFLTEVPLTTEGARFGYSQSEEDMFSLCFPVRGEPGCCYIQRFEVWECAPHT